MDKNQLEELKQKFEQVKSEKEKQGEPTIPPEKIHKVIKKAKEIEKLNNLSNIEESEEENITTEYETFKLSKNTMFDEYFTIKTEEQTMSVNLPSKGVGYTNEQLKNGTILLAPLTGLDEEKLIAIKDSNDLIGSFYNFIDSKIKTPGININQILANDFISIVLYLQIISNQDIPEDRIINTETYCPNCSTQNFFEGLDVAKLEISEIKDTKFPLEIEVGGYIILMKYLTIGDIRTVEKAVEHDKDNKLIKQYGLDTTKIREQQFRTLKIINKENGEILPPTKWFEFYLNLDRKNKKILNSKLIEYDNFGIPFYTTKCKNCGRIVRFQITTKFITLFFK